MIMEVKEVVKEAIQYVSDIFAHESSSNIGLEEITFDDPANVWNVTIGFSGPWDYETPSASPGLQPQNPRREYKIVRIDDATGKVKEIKIRESANG